MFGVNLKIGVPAMAVELAKAVQGIIGDDLLAIQIGNEANNYEADYAAFDAAWMPYAKAIHAAGVPIAGRIPVPTPTGDRLRQAARQGECFPQPALLPRCGTEGLNPRRACERYRVLCGGRADHAGGGCSTATFLSHRSQLLLLWWLRRRQQCARLGLVGVDFMLALAHVV